MHCVGVIHVDITLEDETMASRFDYVAYDKQASDAQASAKKTCQNLEEIIDGLGKGRPQSLAQTKLEEVYMWIGKAIRDGQIERNGSAPPQEGRCDS